MLAGRFTAAWWHGSSPGLSRPRPAPPEAQTPPRPPPPAECTTGGATCAHGKAGNCLDVHSHAGREPRGLRRVPRRTATRTGTCGLDSPAVNSSSGAAAGLKRPHVLTGTCTCAWRTWRRSAVASACVARVCAEKPRTERSPRSAAGSLAARRRRLLEQADRGGAARFGRAARPRARARECPPMRALRPGSARPLHCH